MHDNVDGFSLLRFEQNALKCTPNIYFECKENFLVLTYMLY